MSSEQPLVSIALITYQNGPFLAESIESILGQTYPNIEVIIADDGSTDGSMELISKYAANHGRIKVLSALTNRGISENINIAFDHCEGEYICLIAGDDSMYPQKIEKQVAFLEKNEDFDLCFHNVDVYDNDTGTVLYQWLDKYEPTRFPQDALFRANWFFRKNNRKTPSGSWFGRASYMKHGRNDKRTTRYHEFIFTMGMYAAKPSGKWHTLTETLGRYRIHSRSLSNTRVDWYTHAEEIATTYGLAAVKFPQYGRRIHGEAAYWWFTQLLYNQVPRGSYKLYSREFIRHFGLYRYAYLIVCKLLLSETFTPVRRIFKRAKKLAGPSAGRPDNGINKK
jgi:glycosyltransferase involved in cell wall biosynthesis